MPDQALVEAAKKVRARSTGSEGSAKRRRPPRRFLLHPFFFALTLPPMKPGLRHVLRDGLLAAVEVVLADVDQSVATAPRNAEVQHVRDHVELVYLVLCHRVVVDGHGRVALDVSSTTAAAGAGAAGSKRKLLTPQLRTGYRGPCGMRTTRCWMTRRWWWR